MILLKTLQRSTNTPHSDVPHRGVRVDARSCVSDTPLSPVNTFTHNTLGTLVPLRCGVWTAARFHFITNFCASEVSEGAAMTEPLGDVGAALCCQTKEEAKQMWELTSQGHDDRRARLDLATHVKNQKVSLRQNKGELNSIKSSSLAHEFPFSSLFIFKALRFCSSSFLRSVSLLGGRI